MINIFIAQRLWVTPIIKGMLGYSSQASLLETFNSFICEGGEGTGTAVVPRKFWSRDRFISVSLLQ